MSSKKRTAGKAAKRSTATKARKAPKPPKAAKATAKRAPVAARAVVKKAPPAIAKKAGTKKASSKKARAASKATPIKVVKSVPKPKTIRRRDGTGHLDPKYAADLRARMREKPKDNDRAFVRGSRSGDSLAEEMGEEFVEAVTSGEDNGNEVRDQRVTEELGGPFLVSNGKREFGRGRDASNPKGATREPFPKT